MKKKKKPNAHEMALLKAMPNWAHEINSIYILAYQINNIVHWKTNSKCKCHFLRTTSSLASHLRCFILKLIKFH